VLCPSSSNVFDTHRFILNRQNNTLDEQSTNSVRIVGICFSQAICSWLLTYIFYFDDNFFNI